MSVTMSRADGVTVLTLTADPHSVCPPLCQIFKSLCYSPVCCSVSQRLKTVQTSSQSVLGALQIMIGLLNIGLGAILACSRFGSSWQMDETHFPFWMGGFFIVFGIVCILLERFPSPCLVILNVILHFAGIGFAIAAIVLYSVNVALIRAWWLCDYNERQWYHRTTAPTPSAEDMLLQEKCLENKAMVLMLLRSINAVLIVLSVLELCVVISSFVLGIKALKSSFKGRNQRTEDPEYYKPLLGDDPAAPTA